MNPVQPSTQVLFDLLNTPPTNWSVRRIEAMHTACPDMTDYLEIGIEYGRTFVDVTIPHRVGVDPLPQLDNAFLPENCGVHAITSDAYFASLPPSARFDVVFVDGLHTFRQTYSDLINAVRVCPRGLILVDDVVPVDEVSALPDMQESFTERARRGLEGLPWHGDVFKAILVLADHHPELDFVTVVDRGNPQTLVWRRSRLRRTRPVAESVLATYDSVTYRDLFADGIPRSFRPARERDALVRAIAGVRRLRRRPWSSGSHL